MKKQSSYDNLVTYNYGTSKPVEQNKQPQLKRPLSCQTIENKQVFPVQQKPTKTPTGMKDYNRMDKENHQNSLQKVKQQEIQQWRGKSSSNLQDIVSMQKSPSQKALASNSKQIIRPQSCQYEQKLYQKPTFFDDKRQSFNVVDDKQLIQKQKNSLINPSLKESYLLSGRKDEVSLKHSDILKQKQNQYYNGPYQNTLKFSNFLNFNETMKKEKELQQQQYILQLQQRKSDLQRYYSVPENKSKDQIKHSQLICNQDYVEYQKLQEKLQQLENKIVTIKSNIISNNQQKNIPTSSQKKGGTLMTSKYFSQNQPQQPTTQQVRQHTPQNTRNNNNEDKAVARKQVQENNGNHQNNSNSQQALEKPKFQSFTLLSQLVSQVKGQVNEKENPNVEPQSLMFKAQKNDYRSHQQPNTNTFIPQQKPKEVKIVDQKPFQYYISSIIDGYMNTAQSSQMDIIRDHLVQTMNGLQLINNIKPINPEIINVKKLILPKKPIYKDKKTIVFDLDETLIHCNESVNVPGDLILPIKFPSGEIIEASINIRPHSKKILQFLSLYYEVIIFTASHSCYANVVIDYLDPKNEYVSHRLFREHCIQTEEGAYLKDLRIFANRSLKDLVLVDNASYSFCLQQSNGIPILPFYNNKEDQELKLLCEYLMLLRNIEDVRLFNQKHLKITEFNKYQDPISLIQNLFHHLIPNQ